MRKPNYLKQYKILAIVWLFSTAMSNAVMANEEFADFPTGEHEGGGVRGELTCDSEAQTPIPLTPKETHALTISAAPKLLFYVPDEIRASSLKIVLLDRDNQIVFQNELNSDEPKAERQRNRSGIISIDLVNQPDFNGLKIGNSYYWYLVQDCKEVSTPDIVASGLLKRVELEGNLAKRLKNASKLEQFELLQEAKIGHDAITTLAQIRCDYAEESLIYRQWMKLEGADKMTELLTQNSARYCANKIYSVAP